MEIDSTTFQHDPWQHKIQSNIQTLKYTNSEQNAAQTTCTFTIMSHIPIISHTPHEIRHLHVLCYVLSDCAPSDDTNCETCMGNRATCTLCKPGKLLNSEDDTCTEGMYQNIIWITSYPNSRKQTFILV